MRSRSRSFSDAVAVACGCALTAGGRLGYRRRLFYANKKTQHVQCDARVVRACVRACVRAVEKRADARVFTCQPKCEVRRVSCVQPCGRNASGCVLVITRRPNDKNENEEDRAADAPRGRLLDREGGGSEQMERRVARLTASCLQSARALHLSRRFLPNLRTLSCSFCRCA